MKRKISLLLSLTLVLSGCHTGGNSSETITTTTVSEAIIETTQDSNLETTNVAIETEQASVVEVETTIDVSSFESLDDDKLLNYVENNIYTTAISLIDEKEFFVEDVSAVYVSNEYLEELEYNSKTNIYFGYSLEDVEKVFNGTRYVFTLSESGDTTVQAFEDYDDTFDRIVKNVSIGSGVILVCATISVVSGGVGAPAISMIFAASAKTGTIMALESGAIGAAIAGVSTGLATGDVEEALKAAALGGSEGFKSGAIIGAASGAAIETVTLFKASGGGLTLNEAAIIQKETKLPADFIKKIKSMDEYDELVQIAQNGGLSLEQMATVCMNTDYPLDIVKLFKTTEEGGIYSDQAQLVAQMVDGKMALVRDIDLKYKAETGGQMMTNLERMQNGYAAIDPATGQVYQLHHIGQSVDSPLAILTQAEHTGGGNNAILHDVNIANGEGVHSLLSDSEWASQREDFWMALANLLK